MKDYGEIGHLTKFDAFRMNRNKVMDLDAFRMNRNKVMDLETWVKIHTSVSTCEPASPKTIRVYMVLGDAVSK